MANFNEQWIEVFAPGRQIDSEGREHNITAEFLEDVVRNYDPVQHEAPAVIGHPKDNAPAYGYAKGLRVKDGRLLVQFKEIDPDFERIVKNGYFKKRSASFYIDPKTAPGGRAPYLRHVGFLGAQPPAVKGLRDIQFDEGEALTFEITSNYSEGESMDEKERKGFVAEIIDGIKNSDWIKNLFPKKDESAAPASFTEADRTTLIADVVKQTTEAVVASFAEEKKGLQTQLTELQAKVSQQSVTSTHADIVSFCEKLGKDVCPPAFLNMGLVEFMESLATSDKKVTIISFEEGEDKKKVEKKTETSQLDWFKGFLRAQGPFIQFGEGFAKLSPTGPDDATAVPPERVNELRGKVGLPAKQGGNG